MRTRKTGPDDIPALKALWKQAFGDTDAEIDSFFKTVYPEATGFCAEEDGAVIAMLFALPLTLAHGEEMQKAAYLYAVATDEAFRGRGVCRALMEFAERTLRKRYVSCLLLVPETEKLASYYETMGYVRQDSCTAQTLHTDAPQGAAAVVTPQEYAGLRETALWDIPHVRYDKAQLAAILKVGVPLGLNNSLYSVGHVAVQAVYNMQGSVFVAGCSIAGRVTGIAGIAITSFSSAAVVFAGQNLGAGNYRRLQRGVVQITCAAGVVTLLIGLMATVFCRPLLGLFSSDPAVLDAAVRYTWWVLPFIWTYAVFNCMMSFVNGTGAVKYTTVVNLLILWAVRIPAAYILHALGYGTSSMACVSLSYAVGLVAMLGYFLTPEWGKLRRKAKELGDAVTAETEPTL